MKFNFNKIKILLLTFLLLGFLHLISFAADIDSIQAHDYAESFFIKKGWASSENHDAIRLVFKPLFYDSINNVKDYAFYVYQLDRKGYVAISAWNFSRRILFYAKGDFITNSKVEAFQYWINSYIKMILEKYNKTSAPLKSTFGKIITNETLTDTFPPFVEPIISTTWNQGCYYNELCPVDTSGPCDHVWAGCVAVAMAQIINYHKYPEEGLGSNTYTHPVYGELYADFTEGYNYSLYPVSLSSPNLDLARFIYHCGVAVNMNYSSSGSGATSIAAANALTKYFKFSRTLSYLKSGNFNTDTWLGLIKKDLKNDRPIYYRGEKDSGSGHAFVCDGYDEDGLFHFNLGWGGAANGYYSLDDLTYNNKQAAIFDIKPIYRGPANVQDSLALVALYNSTDGANWINNENWLTGKCADWFGIEVNEEGVSVISLSKNSLTGQIPEELSVLNNLNLLDLSNNQLAGNIPAGIGNLNELHYLYLSNNQLTGNIPKEIGNVVNLYELHLNNNQLSGIIPLEIRNLIRLYELNLSDNKLSGNIPTEIENLVNLYSLNLSLNQLSGNIPVEIGNLTNLQRLFLSNNQLSGAIPTEIENLVNLQYLYIANNNCEELPSLSSLNNLNILSTGYNAFTFEDIEPNIGVANTFYYSPQANIGNTENISLNVGDNDTLYALCGGNSNLYQWYFNGEIIPGAESNEYIITDITAIEEGTYHCQITNTIATELTLLTNPVNLTIISTNQIIDLTEGWNIISTYLKIQDSSMANVLSPLINEGSLEKVQDELGNAVENVFPNEWVYNIEYISPSEGYKIKVNTNTRLVLTGSAVPLPYDIILAGGWNIMSFPAQTNQNSLDILQDLLDSGSLMKVQNEKGAAIEYVIPIGLIDNIHTFEPGKGYKIKVSENSTLNIPDPVIKSSVLYHHEELIPSHFTPSWTGNGVNHMNIYVITTGFEPGDEVAVFDEDLCVGIGIVETFNDKYISIAATKDDPFTAQQDGFRENTNILLKVWDASSNTEYKLNEFEPATGYKRTFEKIGTTVIRLNMSVISGTRDNPASGTSLGDAYPNPFNNFTTINYSIANLSDVQIEIYNVIGKKIRILIKYIQPSGNYSITWDHTNDAGTPVEPGTYFYKMTTNNYVKVKPLIYFEK